MPTQADTLATIPAAFTVDSNNVALSVKPGFLPIASSTALGAFKVGTNLSIAADGTLSATGGGGGSQTLDQTLALGKTATSANSTGLTLFSDQTQPFTFSNSSNTISFGLSSALIKLETTGDITLGNPTSFCGLVIPGGQTTTFVLTATGLLPAIAVGLSPKAGAQTFIGDTTNYSGIAIQGGQTSFTNVETWGIATNISLRLTTRGTGGVQIGNVGAWAGLNIVGGQSSSLQLQAVGLDANIDIVLQPKGAGNVFLLGTNLSSTLTSQPKFSLPISAGSTTLGFGTAGQVLTSNGTASAPYWGSAGGGGSQTLNQTLALGKTATTANSTGLTLFSDQTQPFTFSNSSNTISFGLSSALIKLETTGDITLGNPTSFCGLVIPGGQALDCILSAVGAFPLVNVGIAPKANGATKIGNLTDYTGINIQGGQTSYTNVRAAGSSANIALQLEGFGTSGVQIGRASVYSAIEIQGGQTTAVTINAVSDVNANINLVLTPKGTGNFYPIGATLSATAANQPKIYVASDASSTTLGPGTAGQVLTSNGTAGAPYWGSGGGGSTTLNQVLATGKTATTNNSNGLTLFSDQTDPFTFSNSGNTIGFGLSANRISFATSGVTNFGTWASISSAGQVNCAIVRMTGNGNSATLNPAGTTFDISTGGLNQAISLTPNGTGGVRIGNASLYAGLNVAGGNTSAVTMSAVGNNASDIAINLVSKGLGNVTLGNTGTYAGMEFTGGSLNAIYLKAVGAQDDVNIFIQPKNEADVFIGNLSAYAGFKILGSRTGSAVLSAVAGQSGANCDLVLAPQGTGNLYPIGTTPLSSTAANQPKIYVASAANSTALGPGTAGQVLTSNGTSGAPYWANTSGAATVVTYSSTLAGAQVLPITSQVNTLGLSIGASTIGGFVTGGVYKVELHNVLTQTSGTSSVFNGFFALATSGQITTVVPYGSGVGISNIKPNTNPPNGDYLTSTGFGFMTGTGNLTMTSFVQNVSGVAISFNGWAIITRIS